MNLDVFIISFVQGIGELLPISSSVNMFIVHRLFHTNFFNFSFDIALHTGSLLALILYFRREILDIFKSIFTKKKAIRDTYLLQLIAGTIPVIILGFLSRNYVKEFNSKAVMGCFCILFGVLLFAFDKLSVSHKKSESVSVTKAFIIGIFQSIAIFPGISRLGVCITASRMLSLNRHNAIFFSLFLAIPSILGSLCLELFESGNIFVSAISMKGVIITFIISAVIIIPCVKFMEKRGFLAITIYRCIIGVLLFFL
ncbi:MAG: undecaprenyl-diphosphate phosphatase [Holosporales bacterium]|jgi:undecaprenyl-diphosphatase|nr:undecaprenyl-diphosphate phosphatase [Holosporales bacterium]